MLIPVSRISSSAGLAWAYGMLTAAFVAGVVHGFDDPTHRYLAERGRCP